MWYNRVMRLDKLLGQAGMVLAIRSEAYSLASQVYVDGILAEQDNLNMWMLVFQTITVSGKELEHAPRSLPYLNKPAGVVSSS